MKRVPLPQLPAPARGLGKAGRLASASILALSFVAVHAAAAAAPSSAPAPPASPEVREAMQKADAGAPGELLRLADAGRHDAQYYAGVMLIFGRGGIARDTVRGCAYEEKAATVRADAMHMVGECHRGGLTGRVDRDKAKAAFARADQMGFARSKCALGQMLLAEPKEASRGLALCLMAAAGGEAAAQVAVAETYETGREGVRRDPGEARRWYQAAANQNNPEAARKLGEMYARGDGGRRDKKKAIELWRAAEKAGDPYAAILVADQLFSDLTGGKKPAPGQYKFRGSVPVADIEAIEEWYTQALHDPRPDAQQRAKTALYVLKSFRTARAATTKR